MKMEFNYLVEKMRMLNSLGRINDKCLGVKCSMCPLSNVNNEFALACDDFEVQYPFEATEIVRKWAEEHPRKTRKDILLEVFPNAQLDSSTQRPLVCASDLGFCTDCPSVDNCEICWNMEVEE